MKVYQVDISYKLSSDGETKSWSITVTANNSKSAETVATDGLYIKHPNAIIISSDVSKSSS